nr:hypothetical protein [Tanacetum cinerariifolium]
MFLSQCKYVTEIFERVHMIGSNSSPTPVDTESKLGDDGDSVSHLTLYKILTGFLQYLTFMQYSRFIFICKILRSLISRLLKGFCGYRLLVTLVFGNNVLFWSSKRQPTLSHSSVEAEYRGVTNIVTKTRVLKVRVLHVPSRYQYTSIFNKGLPLDLFEEFRMSLTVRCPSAPTVGEC